MHCSKPRPNRLSRLFFAIALAAPIAAFGACKSKDSKSNEASDQPNTSAGSGQTAPSTDTGKSVAVPKKGTPPAKAELPAPTGEHQGKLEWSVRLGGAERDSARSVAFDKAGNIFIGGLITGKVTVADNEMVTESNDAVIIKLDPDGQALWSRNFGGPGSDMIESIAVDGDGNVIVGGGFAEELLIGTASLRASGSDDGFVAKFDSEGKRLWGKRFGGMAEDNVQGVAVDGAGNIYVSATFRGHVTIGSERLETAGRDDAFLIALAPTGEVRWTRKLAGPGTDYGRAVTVDDKGAIFWAAEMSQTANVGSTALESIGNRDVAVIKLASDGTPVWATSFGSLGDENIFDIAVDAGGDVIVTGTFKETMTIGSLELKSAGEADAYVAKLAADGSVRWAKGYGRKTEDVGATVASDKYGNVYAGGWFRSKVDFGGGELESAGEKDIYLIKLDRDGGHLWSKRFGGEQVDYVRGIEVTETGSPVLVGTFFLTADFDGKKLVATPSGQKLPTGEMFAVKLTP